MTSELIVKSLDVNLLYNPPLLLQFVIFPHLPAFISTSVEYEIMLLKKVSIEETMTVMS